MKQIATLLLSSVITLAFAPASAQVQVKDAWVSTDKAKILLDYTTNHSTEGTVRDTISWIRNSPVRAFNYHLDLEIINSKTPKTWTDRLFNV